jgi:hypothetical protein
MWSLAMPKRLLRECPALAFGISLGVLLATGATVSAQPAEIVTPLAPPELAGETEEFMLPTGALVGSGRVELRLHEIGPFGAAALAVGVGSRFEIDIVAIAGDGHIRLGGGFLRFRLSPDGSPVTILATIIGMPISEAPVAPLLTLAWGAGVLRYHTTLGALPLPEHQIGFFLSGGVSWRIGPHVAWFGDLTSLGSYGPARNCATACGPNRVQESLSWLSSGVKFQWSHVAIDLGLAALSGPDVQPRASLTLRF